MDITKYAKDVWGIVRSPKSIAAFKLAAAIVGVGVAVEGLLKTLKTEEKEK